MKPTTISVPIKAKLADCRPIHAGTSREWRPDSQEWVFGCALEHKPTKAILPVFIHIRERNGRISAEMESDQTDYGKANPDCKFNIRRAKLGNLRFWGDKPKP